MTAMVPESNHQGGRTVFPFFSFQTIRKVALTPKSLVRTGLFLAALVSLTGCQMTLTRTVASQVRSVQLDKETVTIGLGRTKTVSLKATVTPSASSETALVWTSSAPSVATVSAGIVTAVSPGNATITVTTGGKYSDATLVTVVPGAKIGAESVSVELGTTTAVSAAVYPAGATQTVTWSSSNTSVVTVSDGVIFPVQVGTANITVTPSDATYIGDTIAVTVTASTATGGTGTVQKNMKVGINLWNLGWGNTMLDYIKSEYWHQADWSTVTDPWKSEFLEDLAAFTGPIRFMDWGFVNENPIVSWSDRSTLSDNFSYDRPYPVATDLQKYFTASSQQGTYKMRVAAYERMIDLCNRTGKDMWICVPIFADDDYVEEMATLINDNLDPGLHVYLEYANETWNTGFKAYTYHQDKGVELGLPGLNAPYKGQAYHVLRSLQIFKIWTDVFGAENSGLNKRLVRVLSGGGDGTLVDVAVKNIVFDGSSATDYTSVPTNPTYNPYGLKPDLFCFAPYFGSNDGLGATATLESTLEGIAYNRDNMSAQYIAAFRTKYKFPVGNYESGSGWVNNAHVVNRKPEIMYPAYINYWDTLNAEGMILSNQYTLYSSYDTLNAWGLKETTNSPALYGGDVPDTYEAAPKMRATLDWIAAHPAY